MSEHFSKVTITVETGDTVETYVIPHAESVVLEHNAIPLSGIFAPPDHPMYLRTVMGINLGMVGCFDKESGYVYKMDRTGVAKEVQQPNEFEPDESAVREMHMIGIHPGYDYKTTEGQRKNWNDWDTPPEGEGWERNFDRGMQGWERFDYTEKSYWRRKRS